MRAWGLPLAMFLVGAACGDDTPGDAGRDADVAEDSDAGRDADAVDDADDGGAGGGWPAPNEWSWNGSWRPGDGEFPLDGLLDDEYFDGHPDSGGTATPILPPGRWDWDDASDDLANWRNFAGNLGTFEALRDGAGRHYGWRLAGLTPGAIDYSGAAEYFEGSSGADLFELGVAGSIHSFGNGTLGDGPDVLVFRSSWSLDFRTGSTLDGARRDDDLLVAGCGPNPDGSFDVETTTIHLGPGSDWAFVRDLSRAAVDLGDGAGGRTDTVDPADGDDLLVLRGNTHDFRVMGGNGDDVVVWWVDDNVQTTTWLGPNFFGGGAWDAALWGDDGIDRLVLAVPATTALVTSTPTPPGALLVRGTSGGFVEDAPTAADPFARYCVECGEGPGGRRTVILEYVAADEHVRTGYFYVTAFERLQVGVGEGARVYDLDDAAGTAVESAAAPFDPPAWPVDRCP